MSKLPSVLLAAATLLTIALPVRADPVSDFYRGKTIRLIVGTGEGNGYDNIGRLIARHFSKYIPGQPTILVENMPGADTIVATNYIAQAAARDGTVLGTVDSSVAFYQAIGLSSVRFKAQDMSWVGSFPQDTTIVCVWYTSGVKTLDDATHKEVIIGATGALGSMAGYPQLLNTLYGTKFKIVTGYTTANAVNIAMERGEVQGRGTATWATFRITKADWVRDGKIIPLVQVGRKRDKLLPNVPLMTELAKNEEQRKIYEFVSSVRVTGQPFVAPPGIPADRLQALRKAFVDMGHDPAFVADANKVAGELSGVDLIPGDEVERIVRETVNTPPELAKKAKDDMDVRASQKAGTR